MIEYLLYLIFNYIKSQLINNQSQIKRIMQEAKLSHRDIKKIMAHKAYKLDSITKDKKNLKDLIDGINNQKICEESIKMIRMLIRFFRFPILIQFQPFFVRLESSAQLFSLDAELKMTASIVRMIVDLTMFPGLSFYTHSGFDNQNQSGLVVEDLSKQQASLLKELQILTSNADYLIVSLIKDKPGPQLDKIKFAKRQLIQYKQRLAIKDAAIELCVQQYLRLLIAKEQIINSMLAPLKQAIQIKPKVQIKQLKEINIENGSNRKKINDIKVSNDYLCCRPYFYYNQIIDQPQTLCQEYKNYTFPYNKFLNETLLKTIVGFLNGKGGIVYIGIAQNNDSKKRLVKGLQYNEAKKQDVLKHYRQLCQRISPEIVNNQLYKLEYVPIKQQNGTFLPGKYIIRLKIQKGHWDDLYCFKNYDQQQLFAFRTANEVLIRPMAQQIIQLYRRRLTQPDQSSYEIHQGPCKIPEIGRPTYDKYYEQQTYKNNDIKINKPNYKPKEASQRQRTIQTFKKEKPFYMFIGDKFPSSMQPFRTFVDEFYLLQPKNPDQLKLIETTINKLQKPQQFQRCSFIVNFEEQYFHQSNKELNNAKILFVNHKTSRRMLIFTDLRELLKGIKLLRRLKVPLGFGQI